MKNSILKLITLICLFLTSCNLVPTELKTAERLMESKPDSALKILQHVNPKNLKSESNRALFGLLLFQALDNNYKFLAPDSVIDFSINYYTKHNDERRLNNCCFLKAHTCKLNNQYEEAITLYLKIQEYYQAKNDFTAMGKIYADEGDIYTMQRNHKEAKNSYNRSLDCFNRVRNSNKVYLRIVDIGWCYNFEKKYKVAILNFNKVLLNTKDSMLIGMAYHGIGDNYYTIKQFDSAQYYIRLSMKYPCIRYMFSARCFILSDLLFDIGKYDSSHYYALKALQNPINIYTKKECYRILVNEEYLKKDIKAMNKYMACYQTCVDSTRKIDSQTKLEVLEHLHQKSLEAKASKRNMLRTVSVLVTSILVSFFIVFFFYKRYKFKKEQLDLIKSDLNKGQLFVSNKLSKEIALAKELQTEIRKDITAEERIILDKELYNKILHLNDWSAFRQEMNHAFNQLVDRLETDYPTITQKEITWCCLELLDIPQSERILLLDATPDSLYKLKQRLTQKMNLHSTKELYSRLKDLTIITTDFK